MKLNQHTTVTMPKPVLRPNIILFRRYLGLTPRVNQLEGKAQHNPIKCGLTVGWSFTAPAIYVYIVDRESFYCVAVLPSCI